MNTSGSRAASDSKEHPRSTPFPQHQRTQRVASKPRAFGRSVPTSPSVKAGSTAATSPAPRRYVKSATDSPAPKVRSAAAAPTSKSVHDDSIAMPSIVMQSYDQNASTAAVAGMSAVHQLSSAEPRPATPDCERGATPLGVSPPSDDGEGPSAALDMSGGANETATAAPATPPVEVASAPAAALPEPESALLIPADDLPPARLSKRGRDSDEAEVAEESSSCVLDVDRRTRQPPPAAPVETPTEPATALVERSFQRVSDGDADLVGAAAELEFCGKEIQQLVGSLVKRQQTQLRELYDKAAASESAYRTEVAELKANRDADVASLEEELRTKTATFNESRQQLEEANKAKQGIIDCLQADLAMRADSAKIVEDQLATAQTRVQSLSERVTELLKELADVRAQKAASPPKMNAISPARKPVLESQNPNRSFTATKPAHPGFVITGFRAAERAVLEKQIAALGGDIVQCAADKPLPRNVTHVVCGSLTPKVIAGLLAEDVIVAPREFITKSTQAGEWLKPSAVRAIFGDGAAWRDTFPRVTAPAQDARDGGTQEVCSVLKSCGIDIVPVGTLMDDNVTPVPTLLTFLDDIKPAFLFSH